MDKIRVTVEVDHAGLKRNLSALFDSPPTFVSDDETLIAELTSLGCVATSFARAVKESSPEELQNVVVCPIDVGMLPLRGFFEEKIGQSSALFMPFSAFDGTPGSAHYGLALLSQLKIRDHVRGVHELVDLLGAVRDGILVECDGESLRVQLEADVRILNAKTEVSIRRGEWVSISQFLEVTLLPRKDLDDLGFTVNGVLPVEGFAVAHHRYFWEDARPHARAAWETIHEVLTSGEMPLKLHVADSILTNAFTTSGRDVLPDLLDHVDPSEGPRLIEVAFASSTLPMEKIDWNKNSQLNEAAGGVHVAVGSGLRAAHVDFVSPRATLCPL